MKSHSYFSFLFTGLLLHHVWSQEPTSQPSSHPTQPTSQPSSQPSYQPSNQPSSEPTQPTSMPSTTPPTIIYHPDQYEPIDEQTFGIYTDLWNNAHKSWISINPDIQSYCDTNVVDTQISYPICVDDYLATLERPSNDGEPNCPAVQCVKEIVDGMNCVVTPSDTIDYLPPVADSVLDDDTICATEGDPYPGVRGHQYGMDTGIPPHYAPITPLKLKITGTVYAQFNDKCEVVPDAEIVAWQVNPVALNKFDINDQIDHYNKVHDLADSFEKQANIEESVKKTRVGIQYESLRDISCRGMVHTHSNGTYSFNTLMPPSYGPPRHVMFSITAPGFHALHTRMYFDTDWRLLQLTTNGGDEQLPIADVTNLPLGDEQGTKFPGAVSKDPRVTQVQFTERPNTGYFDTPSEYRFQHPGFISGMFNTNFDFVLSPVRTGEKGDISDSPPTDIAGLWTDNEGGLIKVETTDHSFTAAEFPHARKWGHVYGSITGNTIRAVDFKQTITLDTQAMQEEIGSLNPSAVWTLGKSTGLIIPSDPFATSSFSPKHPTAQSIRWEGGGYEKIWSRPGYASSDSFSGQPFNMDSFLGFRYLQLRVTKETSADTDGSLIINEIQFFEGVLTQTEAPSTNRKMTSPRDPRPMMVSCSSITDQDHNCYKAFDGDLSSSSSWISKPVGSYRNQLGTTQWIILDFGEGHGVQPTGMRIVCDAGYPSNPKGCPKTFRVMGSYDTVKWETVYQQDLYDYDNEYSDGGNMFYFIFDTSQGRVNGQRCGSCDNGPNFMCNLNAYDGSCDSRYCSDSGVCSILPECPAGEYQSLGFVEYALPTYECKQCAPGRFGNTSGLVSEFCSGLCEAGHYCIAGSTSTTQFPCGSDDVFCPVGSGYPVKAGSGRRTINTAGVDDETRREYEALCEEGHYCSKGVQHKCPIGTFGNTTGLRSALCSGPCLPGFYCPAGSVVPSVCSQGHYCPDGREQWKCPAGSYGSTTGLLDQTCSGFCSKGHFCVEGATSAENAECPPGRYGSVNGLQNSNCSGLCHEGYYCESASVSGTHKKCGGHNFYCPEGSALPKITSQGYYSINGPGGEDTRSFERQCEPGYYCRFGEKIQCPAGSYGATYGLNVDFWDGVLRYGSPLDIPENYTNYPTAAPTNMTDTEIPTEMPTTVPTVLPTVYNASLTNMTYEEHLATLQAPPTFRPSTSVLTSNVPTAAPSFENEELYAPYFCTGLCPEGYYCPKNSTNPKQFPCPAGRFGATKGLTDASCTAETPLGHYSRAGAAAPTKCPAGYYGNSTGLADSHCSTDCWEGRCAPSLCAEGFYCPEGSVQEDQYSCGDINHYCPVGSGAPLLVQAGHYSVGPRTQEGVVGTPAKIKENGMLGEMHRVDQKLCERGHFCVAGRRSKCPAGRYGNNEGLVNEYCNGNCYTGGYYCPEGTVNTTSFRCPAGRYGSTSGLYNSACSGECFPGYYCPESSVSGYSMKCGVLKNTFYNVDDLEYALGDDGTAYALGFTFEVPYLYTSTGFGYIDDYLVWDRDKLYASYVSTELVQPNGVYCPESSRQPVKALPGYYTTGGPDKYRRSSQAVCPRGAYCVDGVLNLCPAGRFGSEEQMVNADCSGACSLGHYCPPGSESSRAYPCPIGTYGDIPGLQNASCAGSCAVVTDCPAGSVSAA